jgi:hypothetical protein
MAAKIRMKGNRAPRALGCSPSVGVDIASMVRSFEPKSLDKREKLIGFVGEKGEMLIDFGYQKASSYRQISAMVSVVVVVVLLLPVLVFVYFVRH